MKKGEHKSEKIFVFETTYVVKIFFANFATFWKKFCDFSLRPCGSTAFLLCCLNFSTNPLCIGTACSASTLPWLRSLSPTRSQWGYTSPSRASEEKLVFFEGKGCAKCFNFSGSSSHNSTRRRRGPGTQNWLKRLYGKKVHMANQPPNPPKKTKKKIRKKLCFSCKTGRWTADLLSPEQGREEASQDRHTQVGLTQLISVFKNEKRLLTRDRKY